MERGLSEETPSYDPIGGTEINAWAEYRPTPDPFHSTLPEQFPKINSGTKTATKGRFEVPNPLAKLKGRPAKTSRGIKLPDLQVPSFGNSRSSVSKKRSGNGKEKNLHNKYGDPLLMASVAERSVTNMLRRR